MEIIDPTQIPDWDQILLNTPGYSFFHSVSWSRVLQESYGYRPKYFTEMKEGRFSVLIPIMEVNSFLTGKRGVSLPFTDSCEPIIEESQKAPEIWAEILASGANQGWKSLEMRSENSFLPDPPPATSFFSHLLDLSGAEKNLFATFRDSTRRNIKKAVRQGIEVRICDTFEAMKEFYRLLCLTRKRHGLPPQPVYFFKSIYENIISQQKGLIALADYKKQCIAGAVFFHFGETGIFKYGASDKNFQQFRANNLVMWEGIKWHLKKNVKNLSLGRTERDNRGLLQFKSGWGAKQGIINYFNYDFRKQGFLSAAPRLTGIPNKIFTYFPSPLSRIAGIIFYKHLG